MKLNEEQTTKVQEIVEKLRTEMREQYTALREIEDRQKRREKMTELSDEFDGKVREQLRDVVQREQMMRLYQIRMQVRAVVDSLANRYVAGRLELTDEQKEKLAEIDKESRRNDLNCSATCATRARSSDRKRIQNIARSVAKRMRSPGSADRRAEASLRGDERREDRAGNAARPTISRRRGRAQTGKDSALFAGAASGFAHRKRGCPR